MRSEFITPEYTVEDRGYKTPCWIWQRALHRLGYGQMNRKGHHRFAHVAFYVERFGPVPNGLVLDHLCEIKACVNPEHLEAITQTENIRRCKHTILTMEKAKEIRALRGMIPSVEIAKRYGVTKHAVFRVHRNLTWHDPDYVPDLTRLIGRASHLTRADIAEIRRLRGVVTGRELGRRFKVDPSTISEIQLGKRWK